MSPQSQAGADRKGEHYDHRWRGSKKDIEARIAQIKAQIEETTSDYDPSAQLRDVAWPSSPAASRGYPRRRVRPRSRSRRRRRTASTTRCTQPRRPSRKASCPGAASHCWQRQGGSIGKPAEAATMPSTSRPRTRNIVLRALEAPIRQIAENSGVEGSIVVSKVLETQVADLRLRRPRPSNRMSGHMLNAGIGRSGEGYLRARPAGTLRPMRRSP